MSRSIAFIQAEIDALESRVVKLVAAAASDGTSLTNTTIESDRRRLGELYALVDRMSGKRPMFARGRVQGLSA